MNFQANPMILHIHLPPGSTVQINVIMLIKHTEPLNRIWPIYNQNSSKYVCIVPVICADLIQKCGRHKRCLHYCLIILLPVLLSPLYIHPCKSPRHPAICTDWQNAPARLLLCLARLLCSYHLNQLFCDLSNQMSPFYHQIFTICLLHFFFTFFFFFFQQNFGIS